MLKAAKWISLRSKSAFDDIQFLKYYNNNNNNNNNLLTIYLLIYKIFKDF